VPHPALSYAGKRRALDGILAAGLPIGPTNVLRAALSALKGGGLAAAIWPAHSLTLALLDVPASTPWALAAGPTLPAPAPRRAAVWRRLPDLQLPPATLQALARAHAAPPPPERRRRGRSTFVVVGDHRLAAAGAAREARRRGYRCRVLPGRVRGDATRLGQRLGRAARGLLAVAGPPTCLIRTGEPIIHLPAGAGPGGRCQQVALAAATELDGSAGVVVLAAGTDGRDGPGTAAGGLTDGGTLARAWRGGRDPHLDLSACAAGASLAAAGDLLDTGPTQTNVNDLFLVLTAGS
jgi:hydroxypyruvate reductase